MAIKIAINGMGVIGREMLKTLYGREGIDIVLLNDHGITPKNLEYLLKYDSVYHDFANKYDLYSNERGIILDGREILLLDEENPHNLLLGERGVDLVLECTGSFNSKEKLQSFIESGTRKVIVCYGAGNSLKTIAQNVNQDVLKDEDQIISFPQMETQVLASVLKILNEHSKVLSGFAKAYRSFTNAQPTLDIYNEKDFAKGRAASVNISPVSDPFYKYVGLIIPELNGKINGFAYRSPVTSGSIMDITLVMKDNILIDSLRATIKAAASESLGYCEEPLCSSDALSSKSPLFLSCNAMVSSLDDQKSLVNISVVYDNIRGYCYQMLRFLEWVRNNYWV